MALNIRVAKREPRWLRLRFATLAWALAKELSVGTRVRSVTSDARGVVFSKDDDIVVISWDDGQRERIKLLGLCDAVEVDLDPLKARPVTRASGKTGVRRTDVTTSKAIEVDLGDYPPEITTVVRQAITKGVITADDAEIKCMELASAGADALAAFKAEVDDTVVGEVTSLDPNAVAATEDLTEADQALAMIQAGTFPSAGGMMAMPTLPQSADAPRNLADVKTSRVNYADYNEGIVMDAIDDALVNAANRVASRQMVPTVTDDGFGDLDPVSPDMMRLATAATPQHGVMLPGERRRDAARSARRDARKADMQRQLGSMSNLKGPKSPIVIPGKQFTGTLSEAIGGLEWTTISGKR